MRWCTRNLIDCGMGGAIVKTRIVSGFVGAGALALAIVMWAGSNAAAEDESVNKAKVPDYRWVVEDRQIIVRQKDLGLEEDVSVYPEGLTFAKNGDLLMAACVNSGIGMAIRAPAVGKTVILRSSDRGRTWRQQGVLEHKGAEGYDPRDGAVEGMYMTKSGRLVLIYYIFQQQISTNDPGSPYYVPGGNNYRFAHLSSRQWGAYSDDEGVTWHYVPMDISPLKSMYAHACSQIFEEKDGTLVASFRGHLTQEELDCGITSNGIVRSRDGGRSWGDATPIVTGQPGSGIRFSENQVIPLPDNRWLCMMRLSDNNCVPVFPLTMCRSYSRDRGRTWTYPVRTQFHGGEPGMGFLPDGAILCTQTALRKTVTVTTPCTVGMHWTQRNDKTKFDGLLYEISYDSGLTWSYWGKLYVAEPGTGEHFGSPIIRPLDENTAIAVYHRGDKNWSKKFPDLDPGRYGGSQFIGASWLRKVATDDPKAKALRTP